MGYPTRNKYNTMLMGGARRKNMTIFLGYFGMHFNQFKFIFTRGVFELIADEEIDAGCEEEIPSFGDSLSSYEDVSMQICNLLHDATKTYFWLFI